MMTDSSSGYLSPSNFKSLFGTSLLVPSGVLVGGAILYQAMTHSRIHSPAFAAVAIVWCGFGGVLFALFVLRNLFPEFDRSRDALLGWLQLPRTKRYLARIDRGEPAVLFSSSALHSLRTLNRICMAIITLVLLGASYNLVASEFLPDLRAQSPGSAWGAIGLIGLVLTSLIVSRLVRLRVEHSAHRRVGSILKQEAGMDNGRKDGHA